MARILKQSRPDLLSLQPALAVQLPTRRKKPCHSIPVAPFAYGSMSPKLGRGHFVDLTV